MLFNSWLIFFVVVQNTVDITVSLKNIGPIGDFKVYEYDKTVKSLPSNINGSPVRKITHKYASNPQLQEPNPGECILLDCKYCLTRKWLRLPDSRCSCGCTSMAECHFANEPQNTIYLLYQHAQKCKRNEVFVKGHKQNTNNAAKKAFLRNANETKSSLSIQGSVLLNTVCGVVLLLMVLGIAYMIKRRCQPVLRKTTTMRVELQSV